MRTGFGRVLAADGLICTGSGRVLASSCVVPSPGFGVVSTERHAWQVCVGPWWLTCSMAVDAARIDRASALVSELVRDDVSGLSHEALMEVYVAVARLGRFPGTLGARVSGEVALRSTPDLPGGGLARRQGFGSAGQMVARAAGGTMAGAMRSIEAGLAFTPEPSLMSDASGRADPTRPRLALLPPARVPRVTRLWRRLPWRVSYRSMRRR